MQVNTMNGHVSASQSLGGFNNYVHMDVILPTNLILSTITHAHTPNKVVFFFASHIKTTRL